MNGYIYLIYDSQLLSLESVADLIDFCAKNELIPLDVRVDIFPQCKTLEEQNLIAVYDNEVKNLGQGGLVVAGRDILSWLKPVYELGTYSDLDVIVDTSHIDTKEVDKPLLLPIDIEETETYDINEGYIRLNNNVIAVVDSEAALPLIQKIQRNIVSACSSFSEGRSYFEQFFSNLNEMNFSFLYEEDWETKMLHQFSKGKSIQIARKEVLEICASNKSYCDAVRLNEAVIAPLGRLKLVHELQELKTLADLKLIKILDFASNYPLPYDPEQIGKIIADKCNMHSKWLKSNGTKLDLINKLLQLNDEQLVTHIRQRFIEGFTNFSIICTTGPVNIQNSLFDSGLIVKSLFNELVAPYSFGHNGLNGLFSVENQELGIDPCTSKSDFSWLPTGQHSILKEDKQIENATIGLQSACRLFNAQEKYKKLQDLRFFNSVKADKLESEMLTKLSL
ncbi:MAG: hypothetical protein H0U73_10410 [Tatlockia sp.]|nr:hypothetical protein [Tatlockia sp.]